MTPCISPWNDFDPEREADIIVTHDDGATFGYRVTPDHDPGTRSVMGQPQIVVTICKRCGAVYVPVPEVPSGG